MTSARPWAAPERSTAEETEISNDLSQGKSSEVVGLSSGVIDTILTKVRISTESTDKTSYQWL